MQDNDYFDPFDSNAMDPVNPSIPGVFARQQFAQWADSSGHPLLGPVDDQDFRLLLNKRPLIKTDLTDGPLKSMDGSFLFQEEEAEPAPPTDETHIEVEKTWITVRLLDEQKNPMGGLAFRLELPDGRIRTGKLDEYGEASLRGIDEGQCRISFPQINGDLWHLA